MNSIYAEDRTKLDGISKYLQLTEERPELFTQSEKIPLILNEEEIRAFAAEHNRPMGIVYDNSPFFLVLADLCRGKKGPFSYARVVSCNPKSNGTVAIPYSGGKLGLLTIFRHASRKAGLEFPRGFAEKAGLTVEQNIRKELSEELNVAPDACTVRYLGEVQADSGLSAGTASVFLAAFPPSLKIQPSDEEGIQGFQWVSIEKFRTMIAENKITDGFTLSAYAMLCAVQPDLEQKA